MRDLRLLLIIFLLNTLHVFSQTSIPSELMNKPRTEELYKVRDNNVENITVTETNFSKDETYTNKWLYNYTNDSIIIGKLFSDNKLKSIFEYSINEDKKIIESKVVFYHELGINEKKHIKFVLNDSLKILNFLDEELNIKWRMIVELDSLKSPINITTVKNHEIEAKETAEYNYKLNTYNYKVYNKYNKLVLDKIEYYNYNFIIEKNEFGDIVKMIWPLSPNKTIITYEYKYDKENNWVKRIKKILDGDKEIKSTVVKRSIKYKK